ncbi:MAG TPA: insulinase family protein [Thermoplasmata archaeon]|nr:insulinase family protein [Thermoplasmata archaeon]
MKSTRRKLLAVAILISVALIFCFLFFTFWKFPQEVTEVAVISKTEILSKELPNGLTIIAVENHQVPLVTLVMAVKGGAQVENPGSDGLSHLHEHVFVSNLANVPKRALRGQDRPYPILRGTTSTEYVAYSFTVHAADLKAGMYLMSFGFKHPNLRQSDLEKEKPVVLAEYDRNESEPSYCLGKAVDKRLWYANPYGKDALGNRSIIAQASLEDLRKIQRAYYVPNNCALIVTGDIEPSEVFETAETAFEGWNREEDPFSRHPVPPQLPLRKNLSVMVTKPVSAVTLLIEFQGPSTFENPEATYAADLASTMLNNPSSRFQKKLVDSGLFSFCSMSYLTQNHTGPIRVLTQTTPQKFRQAKDALLGELNSLADPDYFSSEEISNAKQQIEIGSVWERERASRFAQTLKFWWCSTSMDYYLGYVENIKKVGRVQLSDYFDAYVVNKPSVRGVLISPEDQKLVNLREENLA